MITPPSNPKAEAAALVARGLISAIPLGGGLLVELGNHLNPLEKRKQKWIEDVSDAINQISEKLVVMPEQLLEDESFVSTLLQATDIAMRNHQAEKLSALRNALLSTTLALPYDQSSRLLRYVDELSVTHVQLLHVLEKHAAHFSTHESLEQVLVAAGEHLTQPIERITFRSILQDLDSRFLISLGDVADLEEFKSKTEAYVSDKSSVRSLTVTSIGSQFLSYIKADQL